MNQLGSLSEWLEKNEMPASRLAKSLGLHRSQLSKILHGKAGCSVPLLRRISHETGISVEKLSKECLK